METTNGDARNSGALLCSADFEGGLFLSVVTVQMREWIMVCRDRYTVRDGKVCEIKCGKVTPTGDRIEEMANLELIGEFDPSATYEDWPAEMLTIEQFIRATCP